MKRYVLCALLILGLVAGCGDDDDNNRGPGDAGTDAEHDAGPDADGEDGVEQEPNDRPDEANRLEVGEELSGTIGEADEGEPDVDIFRVEAEPGQTIRLELDFDEPLTPIMFLSEDDQVVEAMLDDQEYGLDEAWPVDQTAAIEFRHPEGDDEREYYVVVVDERNLPEADDGSPENVGGEDYAYTLSASDIEWEPTEESLPIETTETLAPVGSYVWYEVEVSDESLLGVETFTDVEDFFPDAAFLNDEGVVELEAAPVGVPFEEGQTLTAGVGEPFYRGGSDYEFDLNIVEMDYGDVDFNELEAAGDNDEMDAAQSLDDDLPARVTGTLGEEGDDFRDYEAHYYAIDLQEGDRLGLFTEADDTDAAADTVLIVYDPEEGEEIIYNDDYPLQPDTFFSGGFLTAIDPGEYIVAVEPYCEEDEQGETVCSGGEYTLNAFTESGD